MRSSHRICFLLLILAILLPGIFTAQTNFVVSGYTRCTWDEITLTDSSYTSSDSCILFVTTRTFSSSNKQEFLGNTVSADSSLRFFNIYFKGNVWRAAPRKSFEAAMETMKPSGDYVLYAEGDGKTFPDNIDRTTRLTRLYDVNVIMFDWPSRVPEYSGMQNVRNTVRNTEILTKQFHTFLLLFKAYKTTQPAHIAHSSLFFHSLGNAVFQNSVKKYGTADFGKGLVDNLIFNAACIPSHGSRKWIEKLDFQNHVYIVYNRKDKTLREASVLFFNRLLGCQCTKPLARNAVYFNIHPLAGKNHNYFLIRPLLEEHPGIPALYNTLFHLRELNLNDSSRFLKRRNGKGYSLR
jgi:hypothetical protein